MYVRNFKSNRKPPTIGQKYGMLTIVEDLGSCLDNSGMNRTKIKAICECGNTVERYLNVLKSGGSRSCGCLRRTMAKEWGAARMKKHGNCKHPLMRVWDAMIQRCHNPNNDSYKNYGARGVKVCDTWRNSFIEFFDWATNNGWQEGLQADKDIKGNGLLYSPETVIFVSAAENSRYKRNNIIITYQNETKCLTDWATHIGINACTLTTRIKRWGIDRAMTTPVKKQYARKFKKC